MLLQLIRQVAVVPSLVPSVKITFDDEILSQFFFCGRICRMQYVRRLTL